MFGCWRTAVKEAAMSENPQSASSVLLLLARVLLLSAVSVLLLGRGTPWALAWWTPWWTPWPPARPWPAHCCSSLRIRTWYRRRHLSSDSVRALNVCFSHKKLLTRLSSFCRWNSNLNMCMCNIEKNLTHLLSWDRRSSRLPAAAEAQSSWQKKVNSRTCQKRQFQPEVNVVYKKTKGQIVLALNQFYLPNIAMANKTKQNKQRTNLPLPWHTKQNKQTNKKQKNKQKNKHSHKHSVIFSLVYFS